MKVVTSKSVSWLSLLAIVLIVATAALAASRYVILSQQKELLMHGASHNRRIADKLLEYLKGQLAQENPATSAARFQEMLRRLDNPEGYAIFLIDKASNRIIAHSDKGVAAAGPSPESLIFGPERLEGGRDETGDRWQGIKLATAPDGAPVLEYFVPVPTGTVDWVLGVQSTITNLVATGRDLRHRVEIILVTMAAIIALVGYVALRRIGRNYERLLEQSLQARTADLQAAQRELVSRARLATIGQTASVLAHEMRNPLASIKFGLSGALSAGSLEESTRKRIEIAIGEVTRLDTLLSDTLGFVRPLALSREAIDLGRLWGKVASTLRASLEGKRIEITHRLCAACPTAKVDPALMEQALINLLKNALEACPPGGNIELGIRQEGGRLAIFVENDGSPPPLADRERIFEPFVTTKPKGTGLGLALVKRVAQEHGGRVTISGRPGARTRFTIEFPVGTHD